MGNIKFIADYSSWKIVYSLRLRNGSETADIETFLKFILMGKIKDKWSPLKNKTILVVILYIIQSKEKERSKINFVLLQLLKILA